jgi:dienelactone hydrolase
MRRTMRILLLVLSAAILAACGAAATSSEVATQTAVPVPTTVGPPESTTEAVTPSVDFGDLEERAKTLVELLADGEFEQATEMFDAKMTEVLPADQLREDVWQALLGQVGEYQGIQGTRTDVAQGYRRVFVTTAFSQAAIDVLVVFDDAGQVAGLFFVPAETPPEPADHYVPPDYVRPEAFVEREVTVGQGQWALPGTLTLPQGQGPFPGLVLVHGSGPNDRDETVGAYKPFRDLAWGLASQGVAVLRYEKRTKEYPQEVATTVEELTVQEETIDDALAAVSLLRETEEIDSGRVYVLGHSLGATLVPRIGAQDPDIDGFVLLAGAARPLEDLYLEQMNYILGVDGEVTEQEQASLDQIAEQVARVKDPDLSASTPASDLPMGVPARYWLDLRDYAPATEARNLQMPLLILQGGRDYQVTQEDFDLWKAALADRENVEFVYYPDLNHCFVPGEGMATPEEYNTPGNVAAEVIDDIAAWIQAH